jgi:tetratricopeptide (TPR) repeat protein
MMMKHTLFLPTAAFLLACTSASTPAQGTAPPKWPDTLSTEIDRASQSGELARVQAARGLAERVATAYPSDGLILHYAGFANYCEATLLFGQHGDPTQPLGRALDYLERSQKSYKLPETNALIAAIQGQMIAADPSKAMELGMASQGSMMAALAAGPNNPRVWLLRGMSTLFTPEEYGGGVSQAAQQMKRAIELFEKDSPKKGDPSWGRAEAHVWMGQIYEKQGNKAGAAAEYKAATDIAPNYSWPKVLAAALK